MPHDARKKQKQRLKREKKRREARRGNALTPLDRIARGGGELECYVNTNWREMGMAIVHVLGCAPDGRCAYAGFLVDVWCVGLKDADGKREIGRLEFQELLDVVRREQPVGRVAPAEARRLVAAGIRFARQNGFKLPPHYDRWAAIFGSLGDVGSADLTDFAAAGALRYIGTKAFLRRRLAACAVDEFLARPDVRWLMGDGTPRDPGESDFWAECDDDDETELGEEDEQLFAELAKSIARVGDQTEDAVRRWCFRTRQAPHPRLREALNTLLVSVMPMAAYVRAVDEDPDAANEFEVPSFEDFTSMNLDRLPPAENRALREAMDQVGEYLRQFKSPTEMLAALPPPPAPPAQ
jgi:hypothetical protein